MANKFCRSGNCNFSKSWTSSHTGKTIRNVKCSKCGRLNATEEVRKQFRPRTKSSRKGSGQDTKRSSSSSGSKSKQRKSSGRTEIQSERVIETIRYQTVGEADLSESSLPSRKVGIPNGSITQVRKGADFSQRISKALVRSDSVKILGKSTALNPEKTVVSNQFRPFVSEVDRLRRKEKYNATH